MSSGSFDNIRRRFTAKQILTVPNLLSVIRICLVLPIVAAYCRDDRILAGILLLISAFTDLIDGPIARKFDMVSDIGKVLDPIADKLTLLSLVVCLSIGNLKLRILLILMIIKEIILISSGYIAVKRYNLVTSSQWYGKACTVILHITFFSLILFSNLPAILSDGLFYLSATAVVGSAVLYLRMYLKQWKDISKED